MKIKAESSGRGIPGLHHLLTITDQQVPRFPQRHIRPEAWRHRINLGMANWIPEEMRRNVMAKEREQPLCHVLADLCYRLLLDLQRSVSQDTRMITLASAR